MQTSLSPGSQVINFGISFLLHEKCFQQTFHHDDLISILSLLILLYSMISSMSLLWVSASTINELSNAAMDPFIKFLKKLIMINLLIDHFILLVQQIINLIFPVFTKIFKSFLLSSVI